MTKKSVDRVVFDDAEFRQGYRNCLAVQQDQQSLAHSLSSLLNAPNSCGGPRSGQVYRRVKAELADNMDALGSELGRLVSGLHAARQTIVAADEL